MNTKRIIAQILFALSSITIVITGIHLMFEPEDISTLTYKAVALFCVIGYIVSFKIAEKL